MVKTFNLIKLIHFNSWYSHLLRLEILIDLLRNNDADLIINQPVVCRVILCACQCISPLYHLCYFLSPASLLILLNKYYWLVIGSGVRICCDSSSNHSGLRTLDRCVPFDEDASCLDRSVEPRATRQQGDRRLLKVKHAKPAKCLRANDK